MVYNDKQRSVYNGRKLTVEIFGASHAPEIGVVVDGLEECTFDQNVLQEFLDRRRPKKSAFSTARREGDKVEFKRGLDGEKISGQLEAVIKNTDQKSSDYSKTYMIPRPSHADLVAWSKYGDGFDYRGGGKFSGRLTAPMCIAGGICKQVLESMGVKINAYVSSIGSVNAKSYRDCDVNEIKINPNCSIPVIDESDQEKLNAEVEKARADLDSVGGTIECIITGVPVGLGEYMFDSIESVISTLAFAVPAVKGIEFGSGFELAKMHGSQANDPIYYDGDTVKTKTNHNGGINGGMANGMPITFRVAIKPTPSIAREQQTVDLINKKNVKIRIEGRHDACIVPRAVPVIEAIAAIAIYDLI